MRHDLVDPVTQEAHGVAVSAMLSDPWKERKTCEPSLGGVPCLPGFHWVAAARCPVPIIALFSQTEGLQAVWLLIASAGEDSHGSLQKVISGLLLLCLR